MKSPEIGLQNAKKCPSIRQKYPGNVNNRSAVVQKKFEKSPKTAMKPSKLAPENPKKSGNLLK